MFPGDFLQELPNGLSLTLSGLFESAMDASDTLQELLVIQKTLISLHALDDDFGMAIDGQDRRLTGNLQFANLRLDVSLELTQRLDVG